MDPKNKGGQAGPYLDKLIKINALFFAKGHMRYNFYIKT